MNIEVSINSNCELVASPNINIAEVQLNEILYPCVNQEYAYVEFVLSPKLDTKDTVCIRKHRDFYIQPITEDGLYVYYCIKVISSEYINDNLLYYNTTAQKLYFNNKEVTNYIELASMLPSITSEGDGVIEYLEKPVFSLCQLRQCMVELQKDSIKNCNNKCKTSNDVENRDFLFISIYVLESLIYNERYSEAMELLKSLQTCNGLCNTKQHSYNKCKCHG